MDADFAHVWTKIGSLLTRVKSLPTGCESPLERFCADHSSGDSHPVGNDFTLVSKDAIFIQTCAKSGSIFDVCVAWSVLYKVNDITLTFHMCIEPSYRNAGILRRVIIYLEPFAYQLSAVWGLRVPCPTWLKIIFTAVLALMLVLPLLYPPLVLYATLAMVQVLSESDANIKFPAWMDVLGPLRKVLQVAPMNLSQSTELRRYVGRYALLISTFISCVEYIRIVQDFFDEL